MKILRKLLTLAVQDTNKFEQSLDAEIENLHTIARLSAQYPDLPLSSHNQSPNKKTRVSNCHNEKVILNIQQNLSIYEKN